MDWSKKILKCCSKFIWELLYSLADCSTFGITWSKVTTQSKKVNWNITPDRFCITHSKYFWAIHWIEQFSIYLRLQNLTRLKRILFLLKFLCGISCFFKPKLGLFVLINFSFLKTNVSMLVITLVFSLSRLEHISQTS